MENMQSEDSSAFVHLRIQSQTLSFRLNLNLKIRKTNGALFHYIYVASLAAFIESQNSWGGDT